MSPDEGSLPPTAGANPGPGPSPGWRVVGDAVRAASEVFGPKITAEAVSSDAEAVGRANGTAGGLAGYVSGEDFATAQAVREQLDAGEVKINVTSVVDMSSESAQSFSGSSGIGVTESGTCSMSTPASRSSVAI